MPTYRFKFVGPTDAYMTQTVGAQVIGNDPLPAITKDISIEDPAKLNALKNSIRGLQGGAWAFVGEVT